MVAMQSLIFVTSENGNEEAFAFAMIGIVTLFLYAGFECILSNGLSRNLFLISQWDRDFMRPGEENYISSYDEVIAIEHFRCVHSFFS